MSKVNVRYIVSDVDAAIPFYTDMLDFKLELHPAPGFASLPRGELQLLLNRPGAGGAGQAMPGGQHPVPVVGTESRSKSRTRKRLSINLRAREGASATRSSPATEGSKSSSRTRPAMLLSCFSVSDCVVCSHDVSIP